MGCSVLRPARCSKGNNLLHHLTRMEYGETMNPLLSAKLKLYLELLNLSNEELLKELALMEVLSQDKQVIEHLSKRMK